MQFQLQSAETVECPAQLDWEFGVMSSGSSWHWNRLPREVMDDPFLKMFEARWGPGLDLAVGNLAGGREVGTR